MNNKSLCGPLFLFLFISFVFVSLPGRSCFLFVSCRFRFASDRFVLFCFFILSWRVGLFVVVCLFVMLSVFLRLFVFCVCFSFFFARLSVYTSTL